MKKITLSLIILAAVTFIASTSDAAAIMIGKVVSIHNEHDAVVVRDMADNQDKTVYTSPEKIKNLEVGQTIRVELTGSGTTDGLDVLRLPMKSKGPSSYGYGEPPVPGSDRLVE